MRLLFKGNFKNIMHYQPSIFDDRSDERVVSQVANTSADDGLEKKQTKLCYEEIMMLQEELNKKILEIDLLERDAYKRGYSAGEKSGFEMGIQKAEVLINQLQTIIDELTRLKEKFIKENDKKILSLAIAIAKKIIEKEVDEKPEIFIDLIQSVVKKIDRQEKLIITLNPTLKSVIDRFKVDFNEFSSKVIIDIDPNVSKNFVKVESEREEIIINFEEEITKIAKKLEELI